MGAEANGWGGVVDRILKWWERGEKEGDAAVKKSAGADGQEARVAGLRGGGDPGGFVAAVRRA